MEGESVFFLWRPKIMDPKQKAFLEAAGIPVGNKVEFLGLSPAQEAVVEVKVRLSYALRRARKAQGLTQAALARQMGVPQQTVARLESIHKSISVDMLMRALVTAGVSLEAIADEIARGAAHLARDRGEVAAHTENPETLAAPPSVPMPSVTPQLVPVQLVPMQSKPIAAQSLPVPDRRSPGRAGLQLALENGRRYHFGGGVKRGFDDTLCRVAEQTQAAEVEAGIETVSLG